MGREPGKPALFAVADNSTDLCTARWARLPRPTDGPGSDAGGFFGTAPAFVLPLRWDDGAELLVYGGDQRWGGGARVGIGGGGNATYAWLPLLPSDADGGGFRMLYLESWRVGDMKPPAPTR